MWGTDTTTPAQRWSVSTPGRTPWKTQVSEGTVVRSLLQMLERLGTGFSCCSRKEVPRPEQSSK